MKTLVVKKKALENRNRERKGATEGIKRHYVTTALSLQTGDSYWCLVHIKVFGFSQKHRLSLQRLVLPLWVLNDLKQLRCNSR